MCEAEAQALGQSRGEERASSFMSGQIRVFGAAVVRSRYRHYGPPKPTSTDPRLQALLKGYERFGRAHRDPRNPYANPPDELVSDNEAFPEAVVGHCVALRRPLHELPPKSATAAESSAFARRQLSRRPNCRPFCGPIELSKRN